MAIAAVPEAGRTSPQAGDVGRSTDNPPFYPPRVSPPAQRLPLYRFIPAFVRNPLAVMPAAVYEQLMVRYDAGRWPTIYVTDPALIKTIMLDKRDIFLRTAIEGRVLGPVLGNGVLTAQGADWKWQRQTAAPLFRHQDLLGFVPAIVAAAQQQAATWKRSSPGTTFQIDSDMTKVTFDVISATLLPGGETHVQPNIERANHDFLGPISWTMVYAILDLPKWFPHPGKLRMAAAARVLRGSVAELIAARRAGQADAKAMRPDDLMQRLLDAKDPETGKSMSDEQLIDNLLTFFSAGHETTAKALTWTLYLLARAPEWDAQLVEEIRRVAGDAPITAAHIEKLVLTTQVLKESMRLYPPAPVISRITNAATELGGEPVAAGVQTVIPIYAIHRHKRLWDDPDRFDPTRFSPEREAQLQRYQYMPFGAGPRICIGMAFAMIEAVAILATLIRSARLEVIDAYEPVPVSRVTLRPSRGMPLRVWPRGRAVDH
jgi:cytochrome P450